MKAENIKKDKDKFNFWFLLQQAMKTNSTAEYYTKQIIGRLNSSLIFNMYCLQYPLASQKWKSCSAFYNIRSKGVKVQLPNQKAYLIIIETDFQDAKMQQQPFGLLSIHNQLILQVKDYTNQKQLPFILDAVSNKFKTYMIIQNSKVLNLEQNISLMHLNLLNISLSIDLAQAPNSNLKTLKYLVQLIGCVYQSLKVFDHQKQLQINICYQDSQQINMITSLYQKKLIIQLIRDVQKLKVYNYYYTNFFAKDLNCIDVVIDVSVRENRMSQLNYRELE
ncbi:unnamed protein product [Paramecium octaurelia]|uniref:Uncharacterized protein n=1 Tax=Paramecium octaurelia TaxID=43137 RepID=A0A8S1UNC6_PAROT|nr:unnamed protein product [Paramecium octaurelia]